MFDACSAWNTLTSRTLTHEQKLFGLAKAAENAIPAVEISPAAQAYLRSGAICDLFEGAAPYRPRYILPDYGRFMARGSAFLNLPPPADLDEALFSLMILYRHVPSITNFPVYLGNLGELLNPFLEGWDDGAVRARLRLFFTYLDRTVTDAFCHANLGPDDSRAARLILEVLDRERNTVPNFSLKYDPGRTPDSLLEAAVACSLDCSNPALANHAANRAVFGEAYGVASCYNILPEGGGAYTLCRVTLSRLVEQARDAAHFLTELLPDCLEAMGGYINARIRFLVERCGFFASSFLVQEGLISPARFVGMLGVAGLSECVNALLAGSGKRYGRDPEADALGLRIMEAIDRFAAGFEAPYSPLTGGRLLLHAQVGLDSDVGVTSGVRIPVGEEPDSFAGHLRHSAAFHRFFTCGVGDIFPVAATAARNTAALCDVVKGAFSLGVKYMSFYAADTDLVRITGYLVKRSEMDKFRAGKPVLQNTTQLGAPNYDHNNLARRKVRMV